MREGRASITAQWVAAMRGMAAHPTDVGRSLDPFAESLVPYPGIVRFGRAAMATPGLRTCVRRVLLGLPEHIELRTRAIDAELQDALDHGCGGLVLLGAGLDARAHRLERLAEVPVWEVDHPASQADKQARLPSSRVQHVPVDFLTDSFAQRLLGAGLDRSTPLVWIWEGVTMYLPEAAVRETLRVIADLSPPGSRLILTFATPSLLSIPAWLQRPLRRAFGLIGEPLVGLMETADMSHLVASAGLRPVRHSGMEEWCVEAGRVRPRYVISERVMLAERPRSP